MRPAGPDPRTRARSIPRAEATRRATGEALVPSGAAADPLPPAGSTAGDAGGEARSAAGPSVGAAAAGAAADSSVAVAAGAGAPDPSAGADCGSAVMRARTWPTLTVSP